MNLSKRPIGVKLGIAGLVILPVLYIVILIITKNPDIIISIFGPFGFVFWFVQWVAFLLGGWILAIIATILFLALVGYLLGRLLGWIVKKLI